MFESETRLGRFKSQIKEKIPSKQTLGRTVLNSLLFLATACGSPDQRGSEILNLGKPGIDPIPTPTTTTLEVTPGQIRYVDPDYRQPGGDPLEVIKSYETTMGNKPLTYQQARSYINTLVQYYVNLDSNLTYDGIIKKVFVIPEIKGSLTDEEIETRSKEIIRPEFDPFADLRIQEFMRSYPNYDLTKRKAGLMLYGSLRANGWVNGDEVFLKVNNNLEHKRIETAQGNYFHYQRQYRGNGPTVVCEDLTPAVRLRSTLSHELEHLEVNAPFQSLDQEVLDSDNRLLNQPFHVDAKYPIIDSKKRNFQIFLKQQYPQYVLNSELLLLEEFITDYLSMERSSKDGLSYSLTYGSPLQVYNFGQILNQAGLSKGDLIRMRKKSQIKEFLIAIANGVRNTTFTSEHAKLDFGLAYMDLFWGPKIAYPFAERLKLKNQFPNTNLNPYVFNRDPVYQGELSGCLISN